MMTTKATPKPSLSLDALAARIGREHRAIKHTLTVAHKDVMARALRIGRWLHAAKSSPRMRHGMWLPWLAKSCKLSERTAEDYMRLHRVEPQIRSAANVTLRSGLQLARQIEREAKYAVAAAKMSAMPLPERCDIRHCSMVELLSDATGLDAIVTDPPYAREFVPLYADLARLAKTALKPDGVLAVMCGQSTMADVLAVMVPHMPYVWTMAYVFSDSPTPTKVWSAKTGSCWKPILLFGTVRDWGVDVIDPGPIMESNKGFHRWEQSEQGMRKLVERLTRPGDLVCDPFLGGGTTALVCHQTNRQFVGCDVDERAVQISKMRLQEAAEQKDDEEMSA
jgi:hypothetical protein